MLARYERVEGREKIVVCNDAEGTAGEAGNHMLRTENYLV